MSQPSQRTRLLRIASHDANPHSTDNASFTVSLGENLDVQNVRAFSVIQCSYPNTTPNVRGGISDTVAISVTQPLIRIDASNDRLVFQTSTTGPQTHLLAHADYTGAALALLIVPPIQNFISGVFSANWNALTGKFTFQSTGNWFELLQAPFSVAPTLGLPVGDSGQQTLYVFPNPAVTVAGPDVITDVTISEGQYTAPQLRDEVNVALGASALSFVTCSLEEPGPHFVFTSAGVPIKVWAKWQQPQSVLADALGFNESVGYSIVAKAPSIPALYGITNAYVHSKVLGTGPNMVDAGGRQFSAVASCPVTAYFGEMVRWSSPDEEMFSTRFAQPLSLKTISINLRDIFGNLLRVGSGEVTILLRVYY